MTDDRDPFRDWDAAYVLGALSAEDRRAFERHLPTCPACAAAVAELAGMPGLLGSLSGEQAVALIEAEEAPQPDENYETGRVHQLATAAARSRRRRRGGFVGLAAVAAAAALFGGVAVGANLASPANDLASPPAATSSTSSEPIAMTPLNPGTMTASLQLASKSWGTRLDWSCQYLGTDWGGDAEAPRYTMVVTDKAGKETVVASWAASGAKATGLSASSSVHTADIKSVDIRLAGSTTPIVRTEM